MPTIDSFSVRAVCATGGKKRFLDYARTSENPKIQKLIEKYDSLSKSDRSALSITDLCAACEVSFSVLLGQIVAQAFAHNTDISKLLAAVCQPRIVKATIESAIKNQGPRGVRDRQMLHSASMFLPVPKSATTIFKFQQQVNNAHEADGEEPTSLPSFSADIIAINAAQRGKLSPTGVDTENQGDQPAEGTRMRETSRNSGG